MSLVRLRARWIALRTLGQWVSIEGTTSRGEPIVRVGSERLVLPQGAKNLWPIGADAPSRAEIGPRRRPGTGPRAVAVAAAVVVASLTWAVASAARSALGSNRGPAPAATATPATTGRSPATRPIVGTVADQLLRQERAFAATRARIMELVTARGAPEVTSVVAVGFDAADRAVKLEITSTVTTARGLQSAAWNITRSMADLWAPGAIAYIPNSVPGLFLTMNKTEFDCPWAFMANLGAGRGARASWDAQCRQAEARGR